MSDITEERMAEIIEQALDARARIDAESHAEHHAYIAAMIAREGRKQKLFDNVIQQLLGWGVIAIVGAIGTAVIKQFNSH